MLFRKIVLTTLVAAALPFTAQAQTRTKRRAPARPAAAGAARAAAPSAQGGVSLTARDMALLVEGLGFPPEMRAQLSNDAEERKAFARDLRQMLAAAEEAKAAGYLARPELKLQTELARAYVIAQALFKQQRDASGSTPEQVVTAAEIDAFFKEATTAAQFEAFVRDYEKNGPGRGATVTDEQRKQLRQHYGRIMVAMRKGVAAGLDRDRKTQLVVMLQQARLLEGAYAQELMRRFKATDAEVDAYIAAHSELDTRAQRAKIEGVLARVRAGEDFAKLADEFTEDPSGKGKGGDLGWFGRGVMVKPFEDAAFALKPGEVSGVFETVFGYHIVKLDERRTQGAGEEVHARHILILYPKSGGRPNSPPMSPREQARAAVEEEKRNRALEEAAARRHIQVAEEYSIGDATSATPPPAPAPKKPAANPKSAAPRPAPARKAPARRTP